MSEQNFFVRVAQKVVNYVEERSMRKPASTTFWLATSIIIGISLAVFSVGTILYFGFALLHSLIGGWSFLVGAMLFMIVFIAGGMTLDDAFGFGKKARRKQNEL
jgi:uncharacterized protein YacL